MSGGVLVPHVGICCACLAWGAGSWSEAGGPGCPLGHRELLACLGRVCQPPLAAAGVLGGVGRTPPSIYFNSRKRVFLS